MRYRGGKRTFPYVSAAAVLNGEAHPDTFKDKIVFVGTTALGTREVVSTPLDTLFTGVEVQATVADNLLQRDFVRRPEDGVALETLAVSRLASFSIVLVGRFGVAWGALGGAAGLAALWGGSGRADVDQRRLPVAALSDPRRGRRARGHDRGAVHARARPRRSGRPGERPPRSV